MQLLNNLAAVVAASSILILDSSEQNTMQYSAGDVNCDEFTTILKWTYVNNDNQKVIRLATRTDRLILIYSGRWPVDLSLIRFSVPSVAGTGHILDKILVPLHCTRKL